MRSLTPLLDARRGCPCTAQARLGDSAKRPLYLSETLQALRIIAASALPRLQTFTAPISPRATTAFARWPRNAGLGPPVASSRPSSRFTALSGAISGPFSVERAPLNLSPHTRVDDPALYCAGGISILLSAKWTSRSHAALTRNDDVFSAIGALNEPIIAWLDHYVASIDLPRLFSPTQNGLLCAQFRA